VRAVKHEGLEPLPVSDVEQALAHLSSGRAVALVLCDWWMPGGGGETVFEAARQAAPSAKRVAITGETDTSKLDSYVASGLLHHYLSKPWNEPLLSQILQGELHEAGPAVHQRDGGLAH
jgi:DNA-binding NtrC family response regulator